MDRFAAADLLHEVCRARFGSVERAVCRRPTALHDGGSCFRSDHYQAEVGHLGIARSPRFIMGQKRGLRREGDPDPQGAAAPDRTLRHFDELRTAVRAFGRTYNRHRLIERHDHRIPTEARDHLPAQAAAA